MTEGGGGRQRTWAGGLLAVLLGVAIGAAGVGLWHGFRAPDRTATEEIVRDYLLEHGEVIFEAVERHRSRQSARAIGGQRTALETPFHGAWAGAADGDVTMTVFTDYACTFCRASLADIDRLLREDRNLKVVFRELPILSPDSEPAARLALAAARRGRYLPMHRALFETGSPDADARRDAAVNLDVANDSAALGDAAITRELEGNVALARDLGIDGTPSWVIGDRMLTGAVGYDQLRAAISAARAGE